jgi:FAD synthase
VYYRGHHSGFTPFAQSLFGGGYGTTSTQISAVPTVNPLDTGILPNSPVTARLVASRTGFAMLAGGGVDYKVGKHFAFRPFEFDYLLTRVPNFVGEHVNRNNWRFTAGANFTFGKE